ncbi:MAG: tetratricopeptide repeat protein [Thermogemmatispora sp.]|uniref:serine/threonine-protein kinase n=1 Tax=Thermogemmatispora sp. TaxID=1968838 RepID=UPI001A0C63BB|nr:serine/threonine-protein kinase [Thermogemmatispora sp.]MBE3566975.1 tetratricopeptide repeat protein [Thermogemmatispora sp.]
MALPIGTILDGKFRVVEVLGEGGMGTVYKVEQVDRPGFYRAVKELLINPAMPEEERKAAIERFNKEIDLMFNLKHPNIPSLIVSFQERGNYYFVMEFVPGKSLDKILEENKGPLDEEQVIRWMMKVCEALSYIHSRNPPIILRDLKPGNIMITPEGDVQLIDFGIARRFNPNKRTNTENLGTISYASPEHLGSITAPGQKRSPQNPGRLVQTDARSDIYSLGATMYHLLTNQEPEPMQTPAPGSIRARNPKLRTIQVEGRIICPIEQVIIKAMQQDPAHRFQSAEAMRVALQQCLPGQAAPATIHIPAISPNATIVVPAIGGQAATPAASLPQAPQGQGPICPRCGLQNRPGAKFCKRDGQPLFQGAATVPPNVRLQAQAYASLPAGVVRQPIRARPVSVGAPVSNDPLAFYRRGLQDLNNRHYVEAIEEFKQALALGRPTYDVLYSLARAYRQYAQSLRDKDEKLFHENMTHAAEYFAQAVNNRQNALDAYFQLGLCYLDLGLYPKAEAAFKEAQRIAPQDAAIYYQLGQVAMKQGYHREAEGYLLEGLKINPDHALILLALGRLYSETRQYNSAIRVLQEATRCDPSHVDGWYELGRAHMRANQWNQALSALEQARQRDPERAEIYSAMATCYLKMRKKVEARQMLREALQRDPNSAEALRLQKQL